MYAVLDERQMFGVDLEALPAALLKEKVAGAVWSRTVMVVPMDHVRADEVTEAREHFERLGRNAIREPGEVWRRSKRLRGKGGQRHLTINLLSHDNAVGLTTDVRLLRALLEHEGHEVRFVEWRDGSGDADVNFFLELFDSKHLRTAPSNVGLFNLEWFDKAQVSSLGAMTQLWAKSAEALCVYERAGHGCWPAYFTGFLSRDMYRPEVKKEPTCIHVRGKASQKGTDVVLEAWRRHGDNLPRLIITSAQEFDGWRRTHPTAEMVFGYQDEERLAELMTAARFHVCPSETEGWGHYISEAISCKGVVVTTDASPMHEHVRPEFGVLVPSHQQESGLVTRHRIDPDTLAEAVRAVAEKGEGELDAMGEWAREHWEARQADFKAKALALISHL
jgi:glycosyltransferase involved in cell wall biosynthesis